MKLLIQLAAIVLLTGILVTACKKETNALALSSLSALPTSRAGGKPANAVTPFVYRSSYPVDYTSFNPCTGEDVHVTGNIRSRVTQVQVGNKLNYTYNFWYDKVKGMGVASGTRYACSGHATDAMQATISGTAPDITYELNHETITNKIIMTSPLGKNLTSTAFYHFKVKDGVLVVSKIRFEFDYCR